MTTLAPGPLPSPLPSLPTWRWAIGPWNSGPERELVYATSRSLQFVNNAPANANLSLPGRSDEAAAFHGGLTDLWIWLGPDLIYRGRVTNLNDTISENVYTLAVTTTDYRGLLSRRILVEGDVGNIASTDVPKKVNYSAPCYADIAWDLVAKTQAKPGGNLGIVKGVWQQDPSQPSNNYRVRGYDMGSEVGKLIDDLAGDATFDYRIRPSTDPLVCHMDLWYPARSVESGIVLDLGGTVAGLSHSFAISNWANVTRTSGGMDSTSGVVNYTASAEGRFEAQIGYQDVTLQSTLAARAPADHRRWLTKRSTLSMELVPGTITDLDDLDVGDKVLVVANTGRLNICELRTVSEINMSINDDGIASMRVGVTEQ